MMQKKSRHPTDVYVGSRVRMCRLMLDMSQEKLGEALGVTFKQVQKWGLRGIEWAILEVENARKLGIARRFWILAEPGIRHE
jgi:hypothetical protein